MTGSADLSDPFLTSLWKNPARFPNATVDVVDERRYRIRFHATNAKCATWADSEHEDEDETEDDSSPARLSCQRADDASSPAWGLLRIRPIYRELARTYSHASESEFPCLWERFESGAKRICITRRSESDFVGTIEGRFRGRRLDFPGLK